MISIHSFVITVLSCVLALSAASLPPRQGITPLSSEQISAFKPYTYFASAGYCNPSATLDWTCGANCDANPGFITTASGGDGFVTQFWFVGYDPTMHEVIVSHQGTVPHNVIPLVLDAEFIPTPMALDPILFPGVPLTVLVHSGFQIAHARAASDILKSVNKTMTEYGVNTVTIVGHSLGAAIALLDSIYLPLHLPPSAEFRIIGYGLPRVGNQAFADYVDAHAHLAHINNKEDPIPTLPPRVVGFAHPRGEIHVLDNDEWVECPGQDNPSQQCATSIFQEDLSDHDGPYDGVLMGC